MAAQMLDDAGMPAPRAGALPSAPAEAADKSDGTHRAGRAAPPIAGVGVGQKNRAPARKPASPPKKSGRKARGKHARKAAARNRPPVLAPSKTPATDLPPATVADPAPTSLPPLERANHDPVVRAEKSVADTDGMPGWPYRALGIVAKLEHAGRLTKAQARAADDFHDHFRRAALDGLRAADLQRLPGNGFHASALDGSEGAREWVGRAIRRLGGAGAITADIAWHVLGLEWSLRRWAQERWHSGHSEACGVLLAAIDILAGEKNHLTAGASFRRNHSASRVAPAPLAAAGR